MIVRADILAVIALSLRVGGQLLLVPFLLRHVSSAEIATLYSLLSFGAIGAVFDMGISGGIIRYAAAFKSGANEVPKEGLISCVTSEPNIEGINSLWTVARKFYSAASLVCMAVVATLCGFFMIPKLIETQPIAHPYILIFVFIVSIGINFRSNYIINLVRGLGLVANAHAITITGNLCGIAVSFVFIALGFGVISMPLGQVVTALIQRMMGTRLLIKSGFSPSSVFNRSMIKSMVPNGIKMAVLSLSGYAFSQIGIILATRYLSLKEVASLGLTNQLASVLVVISSVFSGNRLQDFTTYIVVEDYSMLRKKFFLALGLGLGIFVSAVVIILLFGSHLLELIHSQTILLPVGMLVIVFVSKGLEFIHDLYAQLVMAENKVPFITQSILGGIIMIVANSYSIKHYGLKGLLVTSLIVLTTVYFWYPLYLGTKLLNRKNK